jgi:tRNA 2-thiouridine synthesizing protein A
MCPEPVLRASAALKQMVAGEVLKVVATDPHAELDFEVFCVRSGHQLVAVDQTEGLLTFWIRRRD